MSLPLTLAVFSSTKGHFGQSTYKATIESLKRHIDLSQFWARVVHIKWETGHEERLVEMEKYFADNNFVVLKTYGAWKHFDISHIMNHAADLHTLMTSDVVKNSDYVLWLEDDFVFHPGDRTLEERFKEIIETLEMYPNLLFGRVLREKIMEEQLGKSVTINHLRGVIDVHSFNPHVIRARDAYYLAKCFKQFFNGQTHIERFSTECLRQLSPSTHPFAYYPFDIFSCEHIGTENFDPNKQY